MSEHVATIAWERAGAPFDYKSYSRSHSWDFGHGQIVPASSAPAYRGDETRVDPEQAFVASLSSCHMLTFLAIASMRKLTVERYTDRAVGHLAKNAAGKLAITLVELFPKIEFAPGSEPDRATLEKLHHESHAECFLANSVACEIATRLD